MQKLFCSSALVTNFGPCKRICPLAQEAKEDAERVLQQRSRQLWIQDKSLGEAFAEKTEGAHVMRTWRADSQACMYVYTYILRPNYSAMCN